MQRSLRMHVCGQIVLDGHGPGESVGEVVINISQLVMHGPKETVWDLDPHTAAKHQILEKYLDRWFPILASRHGRVVYLDGFSGPGIYSRGEFGSPLIALNSAQRHLSRTREVIFNFVDADPARTKVLRRVLDDQTFPNRYRVNVSDGEFHIELTRALDELDVRGDTLAPTFAFIDPFGFSGVPMSLVHRLLSYSHTEAFINFMLSYVNRFLTHPDPKTVGHIVELFGTDRVLELAGAGTKRVNELRSLYQQQLREKARFVRYFSMFDMNNQPIYDLFFATNNRRGHEKMKEAMWAVDPGGTFRFSDATNPNQYVLFSDDPTDVVRRLITARYKGQKGIIVRDIRTWIVEDTAYLESHMKAALRNAEGYDLHAEPTKTDGQRRRKGTFTDEVVVNFTPPVLRSAEQANLFGW